LVPFPATPPLLVSVLPEVPPVPFAEPVVELDMPPELLLAPLFEVLELPPLDDALLAELPSLVLPSVEPFGDLLVPPVAMSPTTCPSSPQAVTSTATPAKIPSFILQASQIPVAPARKMDRLRGRAGEIPRPSRK
jgi:hypothetical protein